MFYPNCSGHCTRALIFPRWGKTRGQWRAVMSCEELLGPFSAADTAGNLQTTSSLGPVQRSSSGRVEIMALTATLRFKESCTILSYDGANAFNSLYRHRFLSALVAEIVPSVVLCARKPPLSVSLSLYLSLCLSLSRWLSRFSWELRLTWRLETKTGPLSAFCCTTSPAQMCVCVCVCMWCVYMFVFVCVCVFIKLHIIAQSGLVILVILCQSH